MPHEKLPQEDEFWVGEGGEVYFNDDEFGPTELDEGQIVDGLNEGSRLRAALAAKDARIAEFESLARMVVDGQLTETEHERGIYRRGFRELLAAAKGE